MHKRSTLRRSLWMWVGSKFGLSKTECSLSVNCCLLARIVNCFHEFLPSALFDSSIFHFIRLNPSSLHASDGIMRLSFPDFSIHFRCSQSVRCNVVYFCAMTSADWWQMEKLYLFTEDRDLYRITDFAQFLFFQLFIALKQSPVKASPARWIVWLIQQLFVKVLFCFLVRKLHVRVFPCRARLRCEFL